MDGVPARALRHWRFRSSDRSVHARRATRARTVSLLPSRAVRGVDRSWQGGSRRAKLADARINVRGVLWGGLVPWLLPTDRPA